MAIPFLACMAAAAAFYHLPPRVLPSIQAVEGGQVGSISRNRDGSDDYGVMQVNSLWVEPIARAVRMAPDAVRQRLVYDPCFSIAAGAAIMRTYLIETHWDLLAAVGDYHSHTPALNQEYRALVLGAAARLFGR
jgi:soluble lytic murein transglycosylase-like protein